LRLAKKLIEKDESWNIVLTIEQNEKEQKEQGMGGQKNKKGENEFPAVGQTSENTSEAIEIEEDQHPTAQPSVTSSSLTSSKQISLFVATINGIEEIVWEIINRYPHAVEQLNKEGQSILDVAVMHRQKKIFNLVKQLKVPLARLHRVIDEKGNTLLHHVADMDNYRGGTKPGPALELQEELQWFEVRPFHPFVFTSG
jgi:hypothetical protein